MNRIAEIESFFCILRDIRHRMTEFVDGERCGGEFPNFIAIATHFQNSQNHIFEQI